MKQSTYTALRNQVVSEGLLKKNNLLSLGVLLFEIILILSLVAFLISSEPLTWRYFIALALLGISAFRCFALLHDAGHRAMFDKTNHNTIAGFLMSMFCLVPYTPWRDLHLQHHRWVGVIDKDPTQVGLLKLREASFMKRQAFRWVWWLCIPIPSIQLIFSVFWMHPVRLFLIKNPAWKKAAGSLLVCVIPHIALVAWLGVYQYAIYILPAIVVYFFWFETVNFTHHSGLFPYTSETHPEPIALREQDKVSRSSTFLPAVSTGLAYNFNFHTEHHYFPTVPWHHLPRVNQLVRETKDTEDYQDVSFLGFSAKLRTTDPVKLYIDSINNMKKAPHET